MEETSDSRPAAVAGSVPAAPGLPGAPPSLHPGEVLASRYEIVRFLARGGMGEVYEARDLELGIPIALKSLRPELARAPFTLRRFKREVLLARAVSHPGICRIYDFGRERTAGRDLSFLTMELLAGVSLRDRLRAEGRMAPELALPIVRQMAEALEAAHRAGIVHRDFKSANVMLVPDEAGERAVVTDFGIAQALPSRADPADPDATEESRFLGTPAYMAPEQVRGEKAGPPADVYALGVVLYELTTGMLPFQADSSMAVALLRLDQDPLPPRSIVAEIDPRWEWTILRCLRREPRDRFERVGDVVTALLREGAPVSPAGTSRSVLPAERDAFVGRETELGEIEARLAMPGRRVLTLLGAGGTGKTRLAIRLGWKARERWPEGVFFCDLTEARDAAGISAAVATALDVPLGKGDPVVQLGHAIAGRGRVLLVLDNFDQVVEHAGATLARWAERSTEARFLVTSRVRLGIEGEDVQGIEPLGEDAAMALFAARARSARPGFGLDAEGERHLREVVRRLEGLPLAIELAAARARVLTVAQIAERVADRFRLLAGGKPGSRHATLRTAIDGSWEPLAPWEKAAFAQAAVFEGGFTLEAAEEVLDPGTWSEAGGRGAIWVLDVVQALVDKSLLRMSVPAGGEPRFAMYASLQEYARERLREGPPAAETPPARAGGSEVAGTGARTVEAERIAEERHGRYFARFGSDDAIESLDRRGGLDRRRRLVLELDNLIAASRRAIGRGDGEVALGAFAAAWELLELRGPLATGVRLGQDVLAMAGHTPAARGRALYLLGRALWRSGRTQEAAGQLEQSLAAYRDIGDRRMEGIVLGNLGSLHKEQGRVETARELFEQALVLRRELGSRLSVGIVLGNLGLLHQDEGRIEEAREHFERALAIHREVGSRRSEGIVLGYLGNLDQVLGRIEPACDHYERALSIHREAANRLFEGVVLGSLGTLHQEQGRVEEARAHYERALAIHREVGNRFSEAVCVGSLGTLHQEQGRLEEAREHHERALAIHREVANRYGEGVILGNLATLHQEQGRLPEAREHFERSLAIQREVGNRFSEGVVLGELGCLLHEEGRLTEARERLESALLIHRQVGHRRSEGVVLGYLGRVLRDEGQVDAARERYGQALAIHHDVGDRRREGIVLGELASLDAGAGRPAEARAAFAAGERLLREVGDPIGRAMLVCARGEASRQAGDLTGALEALAEAAILGGATAELPASALGRALGRLRRALGGDASGGESPAVEDGAP